MFKSICTASILLLTLFVNPAEARDSDTDEKVIGIRVAPPFVIVDEDGSYSGITIALWEHIAGEMDVQYRYEERDIQGLLDGVADETLFASASALTITSEREESVDFTHPFFVTGLGIAVTYKPAGAWQAFMAIFSAEFWWVVFLLLALLFFWGLMVWLFERKRNTEEFGGSTAEGLGSGFWWAAVTMTTVGYGDKSPRTLGGRIVGFVWMFVAIIVISFFTASIASSLTVTQLDSRVSGQSDLPYVRVGVLEHSATEVFFEEERIRSTSFASIQEGMQAVEDEQIDAFVHDAPIIRYFAQKDFRNKVRVLPNTFNDQYYGIALPLNSTYRNQMNQIILDYINSEDWEEIISDYMGD